MEVVIVSDDGEVGRLPSQLKTCVHTAEPPRKFERKSPSVLVVKKEDRLVSLDLAVELLRILGDVVVFDINARVASAWWFEPGQVLTERSRPIEVDPGIGHVSARISPQN